MRISSVHRITTITIDNKMDCWAASTAMVMGRHSSAGVDHVKGLAAAAHIPLDAGTLPDSSVSALARAVGLGFHDFQTKDCTLADLDRFMRRGPVVAFGFFHYPGSTDPFKHAVAIYSLVGDGTGRGTTLRLIDPYAWTNPFTDDWEHFAEYVAEITFLLSF